MALFLALFLSLAACSASPKQAAQGRKDIEQLMETAAAADENRTVMWQIAAPKHDTEQFSGDNGWVEVTVDAEVTVPLVQSAQILRVTGGTFTQEDIDLWRGKLLGAGAVYDAAELCGCSDETLEQLWRSVGQPALWEGAAREMVEGYEASQTDTSVTSVLTEPGAEEWSEVFYRTEPPSVSTEALTETDGRLTAYEAGGSGVLLAAEEGDGLAFLRMANVDGVGRLCYLRRGDLTAPFGSVYRDRRPDLEDRDFRLWVQSPATDITREQAETLAGDFLAELGIGDGWSVDSGVQALSLPRAADADGNYLGSVYRCWKLDYVRTVDGIPVLTPPGGAGERLTLFVTDDGVTELYYDLSWTVEETPVERCGLLPFEEVSAVFQTMMPALYRFTPDQDTDLVQLYRAFDVTSIRFGYTAIPEDGGGTCLLVPAWAFVGTEEYDKLSRSGYILEGIRSEKTLMVINAVDGSVIYPT